MQLSGFELASIRDYKVTHISYFVFCIVKYDIIGASLSEPHLVMSTAALSVYLYICSDVRRFGPWVAPRYAQTYHHACRKRILAALNFHIELSHSGGNALQSSSSCW